ncbi:MAG: LytTR family DNA-binding domain-containing protein [Defluviitaleaceae bacterium]|nr:LytTR family DNA-binding domain-containing protein [Defluviitaleaceae bacterium]MCL2275148.1 LytTR family DNA-binding domain-containing protein [Defluviitaleaceae bacterium]
MLSIFICKDDHRYKKLISDCIQKYLTENDYDIELALSTSKPAKIIQHIKGSSVKGLYFLDIELEDGYNGVEFAKKIRQHDPRAFIAFITAHPRYMSLTFEFRVEALAYIQKESDCIVRKKIKICIDDAYEKHVSRADEGSYTFKTPTGKHVSCMLDDILFFTTDAPASKHQVIIHTRKLQYTFYGALDNISATLPAGQFYRCHKSYLVNVGNITESGKQSLNNGKDRMIMSDGMDCLVSFRKRKMLFNLLKSL